MYCPNCNTVVAEDQQFCPNCGSSTVPGQPAYQPVAAQTTTGPKPSVGFVDAIKLFFTNYTNFQGRSRRSEFWFAWLFSSLVSTILGGIPVLGLVTIALLIPGIAITIRRLHDIGKSGWYLLIGLIPLVGEIILLIWFCQDGEKTPNQWGESTKY